MARIDVIVSELVPCGALADIGCDHGYVARLALEKNIANKIYITDISARSLAKAEKLLSRYIGVSVFPRAGDGFSVIESEVDQAIIAGMGGEEIVKIISEARRKPNRLVLQPMKNAAKLRRSLVNGGYRLVRDYTFADAGKFYDMIVAERGDDELSDEECEFGRDNLRDRPAAFIEKMKKERAMLLDVTAGPLSDAARADIERRLIKTEKFV